MKNGNHRLLVAVEGLFDVGDAVVQLCLEDPLLLLHHIGAAVKRKHQKVDRKAERNDRKSGILSCEHIGVAEHQLEQKLNGHQEERIKHFGKRHLFFLLFL